MALFVSEERKLKIREFEHCGSIELKFETDVLILEMNRRKANRGVREPVLLEGKVDLAEGGHGSVVIGPRGAQVFKEMLAKQVPKMRSGSTVNDHGGEEIGELFSRLGANDLVPASFVSVFMTRPIAPAASWNVSSTTTPWVLSW